MKKRIAMLVTVVALMMVMLAMTVAPAFARWETNGCRTGSSPTTPENEIQAAIDKNGNAVICVVVHGHPVDGFLKYYDDRPVA